MSFVSVYAEPIFTDDEIKEIISSYNGMNVKSLEPGWILAEYAVDNANLKVVIFNHDNGVIFRTMVSGNQGDGFIPAEIINNWNAEKYYSAYLQDDNIILQAYLLVGQKQTDDASAPDRFFRINYELFVNTSLEFLGFVNEKRAEMAKKVAARNAPVPVPPQAPGVSALGDAFLKGLQGLANVGTNEEIQKRINAGDLTVLDEMNQAGKNFEEGIAIERRKMGVSDEEAMNMKNEIHCLEACSQENFGCRRSCPSEGSGNSCRSSCSNYHEACRSRCRIN